MNIAVIDAVTVNDTQMERLKKLGNVKVYTEGAKSVEEIIERCKGVTIVISGWTNFSAETLKALNDTKLIALWSTGYDQIDLETASTCGIRVTNVRGYAKNAVAEIAVGLMLAVYRKIVLSDNDIKQGNNYDWHPFLGRELTGKTIGIIGFGAIGQKVARIAKGFDMTVLVHTPSKSSGSTEDLSYVSKEELLKKSDIVTLHMPLTSKTQSYINKEALEMMKAQSILINTARGGLVDQEALVEALSTGQLSGAGLDDILIDHKSVDDLKQLDQVVLTPHIGFNTEEALIVKTDGCIDAIEAYLLGESINVLV